MAHGLPSLAQALQYRMYKLWMGRARGYNKVRRSLEMESQ